MKNLSSLLTEATLAGGSPWFGYELTADEPKSCGEGRTATAFIHLRAAMRMVAVVLMFSAVLAAQMDPREIVRRSIATWDRGSKTGRSYSYTERDEGRHLDASGVLQSDDVDVSKTIFVNGDPFQDLVEHNGAPLTPSEARK